VALSPDERLVASLANENGGPLLRIWFLGLGAPYEHLVLPYQPHGWLLQFIDDGDLLLGGETPGSIVRWPIPRPPDDLEEMRLRTWVTLGARLQEDGEAVAIPPDEWRTLRRKLPEFEERE
jgi:hypothetical protein